MQYPYTWVTSHGHNVTVKELERGQYHFVGTFNNEKRSDINFTVTTGAFPPPMGNETQLTWEENEVYIEWSNISQVQ